MAGRPTAVFEAKPPPSDPYRPDTFCDGWSAAGLTVRLASVRGDAHRHAGVPRQDDGVVTWHRATGTVVFAVADGVSSAVTSHVGSTLACRTAVNDVLAQLDLGRPEPDWTRVLAAAAFQLVMRITGGRQPDDAEEMAAARQAASRDLATTLVAGIARVDGSGGVRGRLVRVGDSSAWTLEDGRFRELFADGEEDDELISTSHVRPLPWYPQPAEPVSFRLPPLGTLLVGTDGFGVPLGGGTGPVGELFRVLREPPARPGVLADLLDFSRETFDDDRTLLALWPRHRLPGGLS
ncbi:protein phosphatase 2C domain-containing protein [Streptomyces chilikensis]|uniref:protein phosphatase 2C domain-containing protein n=1 Tax=Streptomyces chilikensis TaxID=1194079 RepID=UPI00140DBC1C|nr:protein phosphatase 2C domain-containing protein [Streptomyces chilikensis]